MRLFKQLLTNNDCYKSGRTITPFGIMWHSTGANNPNLKRYVQPDDGILGINIYRNSWNRSGTNACVHAFIGKDKNGEIATYQTLPWDMRGWHAGGSANDTHIGFEICEDNLANKVYFEKVYKEACELTAHLCQLFNLDPMADGVIICHAEGHKRGIASNHGDVLHWFKKYGKTMDDVRKDVYALMHPVVVEPTPAPVENFEEGDIVNFTGTVHYSSAGAKSGVPCKPGKAIVTIVRKDKKHPYHLKWVTGGGSTVYGWVDAEFVKPLEVATQPAAPVPVPQEPEYYDKYTGTSSGIDTIFKAIGVPSEYIKDKAGETYKVRRPVAAANGIDNYVGSAEQNIKLRTLAKAGKLKRVKA